MCNAPAFLQRCMNSAMAGLLWNTVLVYLDDLVVPGKGIDDHLRRLRAVLQRLVDNNLTLQPTKCFFGYPEVDLLGHVVNGQGILTLRKLRQSRTCQLHAMLVKCAGLLDSLGTIGASSLTLLTSLGP